MRFLNTYGVVFVVVITIAYLFLIKNKKLEAVHAFLSVVISGAVTLILKELFFTARPYVLDGEGALAGHATTSSFPSMHTTLAFALATTVYLHHRTAGVFLFLVAFFIGLGRVLANVHFPLDIFGGAMLGILISLFIDRVYPNRYNPRKP